MVKSGGVLLRGHQYADRFVIFDARAEDQGPKSFVWIDQLEQLLKEVE